jgi:FTR1 family protein
MFEAFIVTLREGIEAALVVGIFLIYLRTLGREELQRYVFAGLGAAIVASLAGAFLLERLPIDPEATEGGLMLLGAIFVASMVFWMWRTARTMKAEIEGRIRELTTTPGSAPAWGLFGLSFVLLFREGMEMVLFLAAVSLTTEGMLTFFGGLAGLALAAVFGVALVKGAVRIDVGRFFKVTGIVLLVFAVHLAFSAFHEFAEAGLVPIGAREMRIIGPIVKSQALMLASMLAIPLLFLLVPGRRPAPPAGEDEPARRLRLAAGRRERRWKSLAACAGIAVIAALTFSMGASRFPTTFDPPRMVTADAAGEIHLATAGLDDGHLHRFGIDIDGVTVRFLVMESGGTLHAAFDACTVCGAHGYVENQRQIVCLACAADINPATIGAGGGCNPLPLAAQVGPTEVVIRVADLVKERASFASALGQASAPPSS